MPIEPVLNARKIAIFFLFKIFRRYKSLNQQIFENMPNMLLHTDTHFHEIFVSKNVYTIFAMWSKKQLKFPTQNIVTRKLHLSDAFPRVSLRQSGHQLKIKDCTYTSCNKITTTWIQISRQNWNGFFSNASHQIRESQKEYRHKQSRTVSYSLLAL